MVSKVVNDDSSRLDTAKLVLAVLLVVAGIAGFYYFADQSQLFRVLGLVGIAIIALLLGYQTALGKHIWSFMQDARTELRKVVWPTRQETLQTTLFVMLMVLVVGLFLWILDIFLRWGFKIITGLGG